MSNILSNILTHKMTEYIYNLSQHDNLLAESITDKKPPRNIKKYHFTDATLYDKLNTLSVVKKDVLCKSILGTVGIVCKIALMFGWILGGGPWDTKSISKLESIGGHMANIIKLSNDFRFIEKDLKLCDKITDNYILNYGITDAFEFFNKSKEKYNEGMLSLGIYTSTIKETVDVLESRVEITVEQSSPDMVSV